MSRSQTFGYAIFVFGAWVAASVAMAAAPPQLREAPPAARVTPKAGAPIDLTGNWVSIVNEDWRWRMVTPPKGDYRGVPLTPAGKARADAWTPEMDGSCKAYGVGGLMRIPTRLKISWEGEDVQKIETDAGVQTRRLLFTNAPPSGPRTLQGVSVAEWKRPQAVNMLGIAVGAAATDVQRAQGAGPQTGSLNVVTTNHTGGWLRKNGVPYSENATITEFYDRWPGPDGTEWFSVTTKVEDPANLAQPFWTSTHFRKEANDSKWRPRPCNPNLG